MSEVLESREGAREDEVPFEVVDVFTVPKYRYERYAKRFIACAPPARPPARRVRRSRAQTAASLTAALFKCTHGVCAYLSDAACLFAAATRARAARDSTRRQRCSPNGP